MRGQESRDNKYLYLGGPGGFPHSLVQRVALGLVGRELLQSHDGKSLLPTTLRIGVPPIHRRSEGRGFVRVYLSPEQSDRGPLHLGWF